MLAIVDEEAKQAMSFSSLLHCKQQICIGAPSPPGPKPTQKFDALSEHTGLDTMQPENLPFLRKPNERENSSFHSRKLFIANTYSNKHIQHALL